MLLQYKNYLWFSLILICILSSMDYIINIGVINSQKQQTGKINLICNKKIQPQIAIFGSSVAEVGISPQILSQETGLTAYNFGIDGTPFYQYRGLIEQFTEINQQTKYIILSEAYFSLKRATQISSIERYLAHINKPFIYQPLFEIQPYLTWKCRHIPFYKYIAVNHGYYLNAINGLKNRICSNNIIDTTYGQSKVYRDWESDQDEQLRNTKPFEISIDSIVTIEYEKTLLCLNQKGYKVIIALSPVYAEMTKKMTNMDLFRKAFKNIAARTNSHFIDFTESEICNQKTYFYNSNHLNVKGSIVFSEMLADTICKTFLLPGCGSDIQNK